MRKESIINANALLILELFLNDEKDWFGGH